MGGVVSRRPCPAAHPDALAVQAFDTGLRPASPERARVLELGCGRGGHLLPLAARLPGAEVVGVEWEAAARERARDGARALGLHHVTVVDTIPDAPFDYVIVRDALLRAGTSEAWWGATAGRLAPQGVAFVAHPVSAGRLLRDALSRTLRSACATDRAPAQAARRALEALAAQLEGETSPHAQAVAVEVARALHADDDELIGRWLAAPVPAPSGEALRAACAAAGLEPFAVLGPHTEDPRVDEALRLSLAPHGPLEAVEDWADLLQGRDERWLAVAHRGAAGPAPSWLTRLRRGRLTTPLRPDDPGPWRGRRGPARFHDHLGRAVEADGPALEAALRALAARGAEGLGFDALVDEVAAQLGDADAPARLVTALMTYRRHGLVRTTLAPAPSLLADTLRVSALSRWEAAQGPWVSTPWLEPLALDDAERLWVGELDGRPLESVWSSLQTGLREGAFGGVDEVGRPLHPADAARALEASLHTLLPRLDRCGLLLGPTERENDG